MVEIRFGLLAPGLEQQLAEQNLHVTPKQIEKFEKIRMSIAVVKIHGIATEKESDSMYKRLFKQLEKAVKENGKN